MTPTADKLRDFYDAHGEKLRYLVVGFVNTAISYALFWVALRILGEKLYVPANVSSWVIGVMISTTTMKYFVFRKPGHLVHQIARAYLIYLPAMGLSVGILWTAVNFAHLRPLVGQLVAVFVTTIISYIGHKYFTFRVPLEVGEVIDEELLEGAEEHRSHAEVSR